MKRIIVVAMMSFLILSLVSGCSSVGQISEGINEAKESMDDIKETVEDVKEAVEEGEEALEEVMASVDENSDEEQEAAGEEQSEPEGEVGSNGLEAIAAFNHAVNDMKDHFTNGHREAGFIYKPMHDHINDLASFVHTLDTEMRNEDGAEFEKSEVPNFFGDLLYDHRYTIDGDNHTYIRDGFFYKSKKRETVVSAIEMIYHYNPVSNNLDYGYNRDSASKEGDFYRKALYHIDSNGTLYVAFCQIDAVTETQEQILAYYDGETVKVGYNAEVPTPEGITLLKEPFDLDSVSGDDYFSDLEFDAILSYDGIDVEHSSK